MNLHHLRVFAAVAASGSVTKGARALRISQPAVSKQLAELEEALGLPLVQRLPRGVLLTDAGEILRRHATTIFAAERAAELELEELLGLESGSLAIGASTTIGNYLLPPLVAAFRRRYPGVHLSVDIENTHHVQSEVHAGQLDFGLTEGLITAPSIRSEVIAQDEIVLIQAGPKSSAVPHQSPARPKSSAVPHQSPAGTSEGALADRGLTLEQLSSEPILFREQGSGTREVVEAALAARGVHLEPVMSLGGTEALKNAVASGLGLAFVSRLAIELELKTGYLSLVPITGLKLRRDLHLITLQGRRLGTAARAFVEMTRTELRGSLHPG